LKELLHEIIHKLRTPAVSIKIGAASTKELLLTLINVYFEAQKNKLDIPEISEKTLKTLEKVIENIENEAKGINCYLDELTKRSSEVE
jgi:signal transduction histidine kinase